MPVAPLLKSRICSDPSLTLLYGEAPKGVTENLLFRKYLLERAASDRSLQRDLWTACKRDILFWVNTFVWTYDPRVIKGGRSPKLPFITWPFQDESFTVLNDAIGDHDVLIEKSRDMGASWICLTTFMYRWLFRSLEAYLMVSRKEALVDGAGDSLFSHLDFIMKGLPSWMRPTHKRLKLKLFNEENGCRIEGESNTANIGRGGRRTGMLIDEFAAFEQGGWDVLSATADNTESRLFNSTPNGTGNAFYSRREGGTPRLRMHWSMHPTKGAGLYKPHKTGGVEVIDTDYKFPDNFDFKTGLPSGDEGVRSPWYDSEVIRRGHLVEIATQLDIDYQGSAYPFFDPQTMRELADEFARPPNTVGSLQVGSDYEPEFTEGDGDLKLWCDLDEDGSPPADRDYVVGCDVSQGTGASDSALSVGDRLSGEKVAELCSNKISANRFAELAVALCRMFSGHGGRGAFLIWEATGPGRTFGRTVVDDCRYSNIYYKTDETTLRRKQSDKPGWFSNLEAKKDLLTGYRDCLVSRSFINPSSKSLNQALEFVYTTNGRIEHGGAMNSPDPSDSGQNHGDVVIADALCCKIIKERQQKQQHKHDLAPPVMSFAWRRDLRARDARSKEEAWE
jgi:hypothetical protein